MTFFNPVTPVVLACFMGLILAMVFGTARAADALRARALSLTADAVTAV